MFVLYSFWWLYGILLHRYTMVCVSVPMLVDTVGVGFPSWLLWTELVGALVLGFLCGHALPCILGRHLGVAWLGLWVRSCLTFWGTVELFSKAHGPFQCMWFPCLGPSPPRGPLTLVIVCVCFTQREVVSHYGFDLRFPNACYPSIFSCLIGCSHVCLLWRNMHTYFDCLFSVELEECLIYSGRKIPYQICSLQTFSSACGLVFHSRWSPLKHKCF